jgi:adenylylsulfate kinase
MSKVKILIFGLPGSGKTTLANKLAKKIGAIHLNADEVREQFQDWDFSDKGRLRQAKRMAQLADEANTQHVIMDFVCPTKEYRNLVKPDIVVFMDTIELGRYEDTNKVFEAPDRNEMIDYHIKQKSSDTEAQRIASDLISFDWRKPTFQMLGRWQPFHDGHVALFKRALAKTGQVVIQVRDCQGWNDSNPFDFDKVRFGIITKLNEHYYVEGKDFVVQLVPNITNITYGRDVGYAIEQETFDEPITNISATKIRKQMGLE